MLIIVGCIVLVVAIVSIEGHIRKGYKQNEEIIDLLKQIKEKQ